MTLLHGKLRALLYSAHCCETRHGLGHLSIMGDGEAKTEEEKNDAQASEALAAVPVTEAEVLGDQAQFVSMAIERLVR